MMIPIVLSREQVRSVDKIAIEQFDMPGMILMENAGRGCVQAIVDQGISGPFLICCGRGNNGGDGFVIARHLTNLGESCKVLLFTDPDSLSGDALLNYRIIEKTSIPIEIVNETLSDEMLKSKMESVCMDEQASVEETSSEQTPIGCIVDALLGTGAAGPIRAPFDKVIKIANEIPASRVAVDIPTGLDCDTGEGELAFQADLTCTFVASKPGLETENGKEKCGKIVVVDIGIPKEVLELAVKSN